MLKLDTLVQFYTGSRLYLYKYVPSLYPFPTSTNRGSIKGVTFSLPSMQEMAWFIYGAVHVQENHCKKVIIEKLLHLHAFSVHPSQGRPKWLTLDFYLGLRQRQQRQVSTCWRIHRVMGMAGLALGTGGKGNGWRWLMAKSLLGLSFLGCGEWHQCWWCKESDQVPHSSASTLGVGSGAGEPRWAKTLPSPPSSIHPALLSFAPASPAMGYSTLCQACFYKSVILFHSDTAKC